MKRTRVARSQGNSLLKGSYGVPTIYLGNKASTTAITTEGHLSAPSRIGNKYYLKEPWLAIAQHQARPVWPDKAELFL